MVSVIDDGFLNGPSHRWFRDTLRRLYVVKAVISLPGDAFQRSGARVKTSFIVLEKRSRKSVTKWNDQPSIFMYPCRFVGIDDPKRHRWMPGDDERRESARDEVRTVIREYDKFLNGKGDGRFIVTASRAKDRLDVKHCLIEQDWRTRTLNATTLLSDIVKAKEFDASEIIECDTHDGHVQLLTVRYDGTPMPDRVIFPRTETEYPRLYRVRSGEIVISNIAASYGSVAVIPLELDGLVVSKEYTVLEARNGYDARVIRALLRSPEIRAEMLLRSTGANRSRVHWKDVKDIAFTYPDPEISRSFLQHTEDADESREKALREEEKATKTLNDTMLQNNERAEMILDAFKPPR